MKKVVTGDDALAAYSAGNYTEALILLRPSAQEGNALAQYRLGGMYFEGQGVPQDYAQAASWLRKAADQGHARAQYSLGVMYHKGLDVPQRHRGQAGLPDGQGTQDT